MPLEPQVTPTRLAPSERSSVATFGASQVTQTLVAADVNRRGVTIEGFSSGDQNNLYFVDNAAATRQFPRVVTVTFNFGDNLKNDASAKWWLYFTTLPGAGNDFGESGALVVQDASGADMAGNVSGVSSVQKSFNYAQNAQGAQGRALGLPRPVEGRGRSARHRDAVDRWRNDREAARDHAHP